MIATRKALEFRGAIRKLMPNPGQCGSRAGHRRLLLHRTCPFRAASYRSTVRRAIVSQEKPSRAYLRSWQGAGIVALAVRQDILDRTAQRLLVFSGHEAADPVIYHFFRSAAARSYLAGQPAQHIFLPLVVAIDKAAPRGRIPNRTTTRFAHSMPGVITPGPHPPSSTGPVRRPSDARVSSVAHRSCRRSPATCRVTTASMTANPIPPNRN